MKMIERCKKPDVAMAPDYGFGYGFATLQNPSWTLEQILQACNGRLLSDGDKLAAFRCISTDSRTIKPGDVFLALKGQSFDGADYVQEALKKGAACVVTERLPEKDCPVPCVIVDDSLRALGDMAGYRRDLLRNLKVIGITGSSGKTTVKEMTASILEHHGRVVKTKGNFNNLIGLPLSLLPADYHHEFALLEMGMNSEGEIARLTEIANPDVACILNVHNAHIEGLGSIEGVARAKGELFQGCSAEAKLIVNIDDARVTALADGLQAQKITFGLRKGADVRATRIVNKGLHGMVFTLHVGLVKGRVSTKTVGLHNVSNCLAAAAIAHALDVNCEDIIYGLKNYEPAAKRLEIGMHSSGILLVNDSYNANPASMRAAIETVSGMRKGEKAVAVLGDMLELGDYGMTAHREIGTMVARNAFSYLLAVGEYSAVLVKAARMAGMDANTAFSFADKEALTERLVELIRGRLLRKGDIILFKGSRGMRMETVIDHLMIAGKIAAA